MPDNQQVENIYGIATGPKDDPTFHYVGKTVKTVQKRWSDHVWECRNTGSAKPLYEHMRRMGWGNFYVLFIDTTASGLTEADYVKLLRAEGHPLLNANGGNTKVAKKRDDSWKKWNREVLDRLEALDFDV